MSLLKQPSEVTSNLCIKGMIYGQPGTGKSTVALSMPNPVCIDADKGMYRVEKRFQVPSLPMTNYESVLELMDSPELDQFQTIVFDTAGKMIDTIADYVGRMNPKNRQGNGALSMVGWGALKTEFQNLLKRAEAKNKHLIFVAHEKEEKDGDTRIVRPDISGSSGKDLLKDLDFVGYMEMRGNKRTISFTPCEKFYAKNSLKLPSYIDIPDTEKGNAFMQGTIVSGTLERVRQDDMLAKKYEEILAHNKALIDAVKDADGADKVLEETEKSEVVWDSSMIAKKLLWEKAKSLKLAYSKEQKKFVPEAPKAEEKPAAAAADQAKEKEAEKAASEPKAEGKSKKKSTTDNAEKKEEGNDPVSANANAA